MNTCADMQTRIKHVMTRTPNVGFTLRSRVSDDSCIPNFRRGNGRQFIERIDNTDQQDYRCQRQGGNAIVNKNHGPRRPKVCRRPGHQQTLLTCPKRSTVGFSSVPRHSAGTRRSGASARPSQLPESYLCALCVRASRPPST